MVNYAYAVLKSQERIATVSQGLDPTIGYLHACRPGRPALVYDLIRVASPASRPLDAGLRAFVIVLAE
jgi:hypothetical protein